MMKPVILKLIPIALVGPKILVNVVKNIYVKSQTKMLSLKKYNLKSLFANIRLKL